MKQDCLLSGLLFFLIIPNLILADIRICTQNLANFGFHKTVNKRTKKSPYQLAKQELALVKNFQLADCDIIATQEVISTTPKEAEEVLEQLQQTLRKLTNQDYLVLSGKSNDPLSKLGYIYRKDLFKLEFSKSYSFYRLEPMTRWEKNRYFSRGPLRIDLKVLPSGKNLTLFNFHFKSAASYHSFDSSKFQFEYDRIQMAQGLYDIASHVERAYPERTIILLGDRNSNPTSASAQILAGNLDIRHLQQQICHLSKDRTVKCPFNLPSTTEYISLIKELPLLESQQSQIPKKQLLIDDILIAKKDYHLVKRELQTKSLFGKLPLNKEASDHGLLYITLK